MERSTKMMVLAACPACHQATLPEDGPSLPPGVGSFQLDPTVNASALPIVAAGWRGPASAAEVSRGFKYGEGAVRRRALKAKKRPAKATWTETGLFANGIPNLLLARPNLFSGGWPRPRRGDA